MAEIYEDSLKNPLRYLYFSGLHPNGKIGQNIFFFISLAILLLTNYLGLLLFVYEGFDLKVFIKVSETSFFVFHGLDKMYTLYIKKQHLVDLLEKIKHFWKFEDFQQENNELYEECQMTFKELNKRIIVVQILALSIVPFFMMRPVILRQRILPLDTYIPEGTPYFLLLILNNYVVIYVSISALAYVIFNRVIFTLLKIQFKLLHHRIRELNTDQSELNCLKDLKVSINHHNFLLSVLQKVSQTFGMSYLRFIAYVTLSLCVELYILSTRPDPMQIMKCLMYMTGISVEFVLFYCVPVQILSDEAEKFSNSVYFSNWYRPNIISVRKSLLLMIVRGNKGSEIIAGGLMKLNLAICVSVYKTVFTFYTFLKTIETQKSQK